MKRSRSEAPGSASQARGQGKDDDVRRGVIAPVGRRRLFGLGRWLHLGNKPGGDQATRPPRRVVSELSKFGRACTDRAEDPSQSHAGVRREASARWPALKASKTPTAPTN